MKTSQLKDIVFTAGYWQSLSEINRQATIPRCHRQCEETGRIEAMKLNWQDGQPNQPHHFWDSDVAKWMEAAAYSLQSRPDSELEHQLDEVIGLIEKAQMADGYFNSYFQQIELHKRWTNLTSMHELYCAGHLMEAAVAHYQTTGNRRFLGIMCRYADYIDSIFGPEEGKKKGYPGHEEIELVLVKLSEATGKEKYLRLAKYFIDQRGTEPNYFVAEQKDENRHSFDPKYFQAHIPVREQKEALGHAVRAVYLYTGMTDVAIRTEDTELLQACRTLWENIAQKKMYVTGSVGSCYFGETFQAPYDLPNEEAYAETCAAIGLIFFSYRLFQADHDARYIDVLERALYNGANSGISLDGKYFFYVNPLACYPAGTLPNGRHHEPRPEWYNCACCPPNVARLRASVGQYFYEVAGDTVYVNLFNSSKTELTVAGKKIVITQTTDYPWNGTVSLKVAAPADLKFQLAIRRPGWCRNAALTLNGEQIPPADIKGYAVIERTWNDRDQLELTLPMPAEFVYANPKVRHDTGRVAIQRGPLIYCLEECDNGADLNAIQIDRTQQPTAVPSDEFGGSIVLKLRGNRLNDWSNELYRTSPPSECEVELTAAPYYCWGNRKFGEMLVWIRSRAQ